MHSVRMLSGVTVRVPRRWLERLRMLADWQLRQAGYCPASVTAACLRADAGN